MFRHPLPLYWACLLSVAAAGCVGTDYIADPRMRMPPRLVINPGMAALQIGEQLNLEVAVFDEFGEPDSTAVVTFTSEDPEIATVGTDGTVDAIGPGQGTITATVLDADTVFVMSTALVSVVEDPTTQLALIRVSPTSADLSIGDTLQFAAVSLNALGGALVDDGYAWASTDESILTIDASGAAIALAAGNARVRAAASGIQSSPAEVTVLGTHLRGTFSSRGGYNAEGTALLAPNDDGRLVLSFLDDFLIDPGPRLEVFLSQTDAVAPGSLSLGELKAQSGVQSYDLPDGTELGDFGWVIIHCVPFNVSFGLAELQ